MHGLARIAKQYIEHFENAVHVFRGLYIAACMFDKLPKSETWYAGYLESWLARAFTVDEDLFKRDEFMQHFGKNRKLDNFLMRVSVSTRTKF